MSLQTVKILPCKCKHDFQDKEYVKNNRLYNRGVVGGPKENPYAKYTCTVCASTTMVYK